VTGAHPQHPWSLGRGKRLCHDLEYANVFGARMRKARGPLSGFSVPNQLGHYRLGLAIGKSVGNSVVRHRVKRLVREAFRLAQHDLPRTDAGCYDLVVSVRGTAPGSLDELRGPLMELASLLHAEWQRRSARQRGPDGSGSP